MCLLRVSQVSHLDASSCDGNRNGQKLEADTANGSLKLGGMVTSLSLSLSLDLLQFYSLTDFHTPLLSVSFHSSSLRNAA